MDSLTVENLIPNRICCYVEIDGEYTSCIKLYDVIDVIKEIVRQKCYEQRKLCADNAEIQFIDEDWPWDTSKITVRKSSILNSPEPTL